MTESTSSLWATFRALAAGQGEAKHVRLYTVAFTVVVTAFFGLLVSSVHTVLTPIKERNQRAARQRVILELFGLAAADAALGAQEIDRRFEQDIEVLETEAPEGGTYTCYRQKAAEAGRVVIPLAGRGFWGPVRGFLALEPGSGTIAGVAFTRHEETPGLGGRITEPDFRSQFAGKSYTRPGADGLRIRVVRGGADGPREVDAITGATGTSDAVERMINRAIEHFLRLGPAAGADAAAGGRGERP